MLENSNQDTTNQIYLHNRKYTDYYDDYKRGYLSSHSANSLLMYAKSAFIKAQYAQCVQILKKIDKNINTKILYERQALLFKATYLLEPDDINALEIILVEYDRSKTRCPGKRLTEFHHNNMRDLMNVVVQGRQMSLRMKEINKQELIDRIKVQQKRAKYEGMPSYLISTNWNKAFNQYLLKDKPYPGPATNFQLLNHIFELQPHEQPGKQYMDTLIFPLIQEVDYYVLTSRHWNLLQQVFSGLPIKRFFINNPKTRQINGGDNLVKSVILHQNQKIIMQWLYGSFWEKSILPILMKKYGTGQLKQQTRNKDFVIVHPGRIQQPYSHLKYVSIQSQAIRAVGEVQLQKKKKIISYFDLQKYLPSQCEHNYAVGLVNLSNTCYMNAALQLLTSLKNFSDYFLTNRYLSKINLSVNNKDGSYGLITCAYADLVKRLLFSSKQTRYIDPTSFKQVFGNRFTLFQGNDQQDAQQFLMFLLNCLHEDLNQKSNMNIPQRESLGNKTFQNVRDTVVNHYNRHNKSIISDLFHGFHFQQIMCDQCKFPTYRFENSLMLHIQVPPDNPKITVLVVQQSNLKEAKRVDVYTKKIQKVSQLINVVKNYFSIKAQNDVIPFIFSDNRNQWADVTPDMNVSSIAKSLSNNSCYFFLHQIRHPQVDQQIAMITYENSDKQKTSCDGFPRFLIMKKIYRQDQYKEQVLNVVFSTIPKSKFERDKKQYIKQVTPKKIKSHKAYEVQYLVETNYSIGNYNNTNINKVLGENEFDQAINLSGCLQRMRKSQTIQQNQKWSCERCRQIRKAHKTDKIHSTGKYLIVHLKRFTQNLKITTKIEYPINNFDMTPFIEQDKNKKKSVYNLQAVIVHKGSLNYGHYTCICRTRREDGGRGDRGGDRNGDRWVYYDDQIVRDIEEELVVDANAYILAYERVDDNASYVSMISII